MTGDHLVRHLRLFWRAETIVADIRMRRMAIGFCAMGAALLFGFLAVVTLSIAAYFALEPLWGAAWSAAAIAGAQIWLAAIAILIAARPAKSREADLALEVRDETLRVLSDDVRDLQREVTSFARLIRHPFDGAFLSLLGPLAGFIVKSLTKSDEPAKTG